VPHTNFLNFVSVSVINLDYMITTVDLCFVIFVSQLALIISC